MNSQLEQNIMESFRLVKSDVVKLQSLLTLLSQNQEKLLRQLGDTREKEISLYYHMKDLKAEKNVERNRMIVSRPIIKKINKIVKIKVNAKRVRKRFVASKTSRKFHALNCIFAKNIKPKSKIIFKSKNRALNKGLKACDCVKR